MRLKKLELNGFKSFAEKIPLNFDSDVIALVGPNGCGKSNIVDAMLWVLGEQSARSLRAEKMPDVLFAGAEGVKPVNFAEVALTLTDVSHFPGGEEVTITRRLYRDGEMQYLINRKDVRLKDINELFLGTGAGKNAFFVFEQGKIDEIINMSPEKRRSIFEETAGISRFLQKKKEAVSELTEVEKNYHRLNDLHGEIEKQLRTLQRQAARAKSYKESKDQLHAYEKAIFFFRAKEIDETIHLEQQRLLECATKMSTYEEKISYLEQTLAEWKQKEEASEKEKEQQQKHYFQLDSLLKLSEVELRGTEEAISHVQEREKKSLLSREKLLTSQETKKVEKGALLSQLATVEEEKKIVENERFEKEKNQAALEKELSVLLVDEKKMQKSLLEKVQKESALKNRIQEKELKKESALKTISQVDIKLNDLEKMIVDSAKRVIQKRKEVEKLSVEIEKEKSETEACELHGKTLIAQIEVKTKEKEKVDKEVSELSAQIKALIHLQKAHVGFSNGAKALLKEALDSKSELFGKVEELYKYIVPEEGSEKSLSLAMRSYEETLVVKENTDFTLIFGYAAKKKIGEFSLILLEDLKKVNKKSPSIQTFLLAKDIDEARKLRQKNPNAEIVTDEGIFIDHHGVFFCRGQAGVQDTSLFVREAEVKKRQKSLELLEKKQKDLFCEWETLLAQKKEWEGKRFFLEEKRRKKEMTLLQENFYLQRAIEDQNQAKNEKGKLSQEKNIQQIQMKKFDEELEQINISYDEASKELEAIKNSEGLLEKQLKEKKSILEEKTSQALDAKKRFDKVLGLYYSLKEKIKILEIKREEDKREYDRLSSDIAESAELMGSYFAKKERLEIERASRREDKEKSRGIVSNIEAALKEQKARKKECEQELHQEKKKIRECEKEKHHIELLLIEKKTAFEALEKQLQEIFHLNFEEVKEENIVLDFPLKEAEERVHRLRYELENGSNINMASIEECEVQEKRFTELDGQLTDVKKAKEDLEKIIAKLDQESRRLFKVIFEEVRRNFQKNFQILFNGGEADLTFTQDGDLLEKGVEIIAKPPGKKMRSLSLLSGGEKCMTTLALLFALFEVKPAPFCILDEVDAPLDEANVSRFTNLLKEFVPKTQFIIVTHNKKTMAAADMLVGVSMEKRGVSKLVSLAFKPKQPSSLQENSVVAEQHAT